MPRHSDDPVRHIVTFRVNSEDKRFLDQLAKQAGSSVSDFMRTQFRMLKESQRQEPKYQV